MRRRRLCIVGALCVALLRAVVAARNITGGGYSFANPTPNEDALARIRGYRDPEGVAVHERLRDVPREAWHTGRAGRVRCERRAGATVCDTARVCGAACERVLLRVSKPCGNSWCPAARTYLRCFARLCFDRLVAGRGRALPWLSSSRRPEIDKAAFAILRWHRPPPRYERVARRNRQTASQSAIFR